jgi:hypothetical protein
MPPSPPVNFRAALTLVRAHRRLAEGDYGIGALDTSNGNGNFNSRQGERPENFQRTARGLPQQRQPTLGVRGE